MIRRCPYPGLRPFEPEDTELFFGRDAQIEQLLDKLAGTRFISAVGWSGCGKSSLVNAGMIPALASGLMPNASFRWRIARMRPGNQPLHNLAEALQPILTQRPEHDKSDLPFLLASLRRGPLSLLEIFHEIPLPKQTNLLIVVDQFEELFRYHHEGGKDETEAFVKLMLASVQQDDIPIYIVTTMRSEFIGECALFFDLPEMMNEGQFLTPRLTRDQQREAIEEPAKLVGGAIEPRLVNTLLNEMGADPDQLPVLQHCLMRMWTKQTCEISETSQVCLTIEDYEAVGALQDALSRHADEAYNDLNENQQNIAETMFRRLTEGDRRRPVTLREVAEVAQASTSEVETVTTVFRRADRCFLRPYGDEVLQAETILDISHESLIRQWKQLDEWVQEETTAAETYQNLEKEAIQWDKHTRQADFLQHGAKLALMLDWQTTKKPTVAWAQRYGTHFDLAMDFLIASHRRKSWMTFLKVAIPLFMMILLGSFSIWALKERATAIQERIAKENALSEVNKRRNEAVNAFNEAEIQKQKAIHAQQNAEQAQKDAESYNSSLKYLLSKNQVLTTQIVDLIKSNLRPVEDMGTSVPPKLVTGGIIEQINAIEILSVEQVNMLADQNGATLLELGVMVANTGYQDILFRNYQLTFYCGDTKSTIAAAKKVGITVGHEAIFLEAGKKNQVSFRIDMGKETYQIQDTFLHILSVIASPSETPAIWVRGKFELTVTSPGGETAVEESMIEWAFTPPIRLNIALE